MFKWISIKKKNWGEKSRSTVPLGSPVEYNWMHLDRQARQADRSDYCQAKKRRWADGMLERRKERRTGQHGRTKTRTGREESRIVWLYRNFDFPCVISAGSGSAGRLLLGWRTGGPGENKSKLLCNLKDGLRKITGNVCCLSFVDLIPKVCF